jgi:tellurite methyltransferase
MSRAEREKWNAAFAAKTDNPRASGAPSAFIADAPGPPRPGAWALDLGAGRGRHARALAEKGWQVLAVDAAVEAHFAAGSHPGVTRLLVDLDHWRPAPDSFDLIVAAHYLNRALAPDLERALRPQGHLRLEYRLGERRQDGSLPPFRVLPGEVRELFPRLEVLISQEEREETGGQGRYDLVADRL